ncbi:hypothetical protein NQZ68_027452 [Xyrichtys novacula]|uniref:Uncharacterized protein n=1 Tax=Xyrichtys novacula TaxID=13765 RepID=A0AAV1FXF9_XYRNO|nr:hypothetical protein NQZ68_027452 [Xyrichtys novacula]
METLTSSHECNSCLKKSKTIAELERRISSLHWIRNEESLLDSMLTLGAGLPVNPAELDSTIPAAAAPQAPPAPASAAAASGSPPSTAEAPAEPAHPQPGEPWLTQGARPKRVPAPALDFTPHPRFNIRSSTPRSTAAAKRRTSLKPLKSHFDLQLSSRYDVLSVADFPPLPGRPDPGPADVGRSAASPPSSAGNEEVNVGMHTGPRRPLLPPSCILPDPVQTVQGTSAKALRWEQRFSGPHLRTTATAASSPTVPADHGNHRRLHREARPFF